jgi:hypothetical protein
MKSRKDSDSMSRVAPELYAAVEATHGYAVEVARRTSFDLRNDVHRYLLAYFATTIELTQERCNISNTVVRGKEADKRRTASHQRQHEHQRSLAPDSVVDVRENHTAKEPDKK